MAKSRKGKVASERLFIKTMTETFNKKLNQVSYEKRAKLYESIYNFICSRYSGEQLDLLMKALKSVDNATEFEITIAMDKALEKVRLK